MRHILSLMVVSSLFSGVLGCKSPALRSSTPSQPDTLEVRQPEEVRIPMSDGVELAGDLFLPEGVAPFPTLVRATPYERLKWGGWRETNFAEHGYAVLIVSFRGRHGSGGVPVQSERRVEQKKSDYQDGYDIIEWAAAQPWSDGKVGTYGVSSDGQWQLTMATTHPPHLRAMFVRYPAGSEGLSQRGVRLGTVPAWYAKFSGLRPLDTPEDWKSLLEEWRITQVPFIATFLQPRFIDVMMNATNEDYLVQLDRSHRFAEIEVPVYLECGWYDRYIRSTFDNFRTIRAAAASHSARSTHKLIMGPWMHGGRLPDENDDIRFGPDAKSHSQGRMRRWFDYWLKGNDNGIAEEPRVELYVLGEEEWIEVDSWPPPPTQVIRYYLRSGNGQVTMSLNDGRLTREPPQSDEKPDEWIHDPYDPVLSIGGHGGIGRQWPAGPLDQRPSEARSLTFSTGPLVEDLRVVGEVGIRFFASSSAIDTDFILTLTDVFPSGYSAILRQNAIGATFRLGTNPDRKEPMEPDKVYEFTLALDGIANLFKAGHRIRLDIASSSFPAFLPNPGTGEPQLLATKGVTAHNAIYHDSRYPSTITIPVLAE